MERALFAPATGLSARVASERRVAVLKAWVRSAAIRVTANERAQAALERTVRRLHFLMGVGAGSYVASSGEAALVDRLERGRKSGQPLCVLDVGANKGQFSELLLEGISGDLRVHCFEPARLTFEMLVARFGGDSRLILNNFALGSRSGSARLHYDEPGSGLASVYQRRLDHQPGLRFTQSEEISVRTVDEYCAERELDRIDLLKIDAEGHELDVLRGAERSLQARKVRMVTFEFGGCNIDSRTYLQDFFHFFSAMSGGRMYRITPSGFMMPLERYREDREQFGVTNYLVVYD